MIACSSADPSSSSSSPPDTSAPDGQAPVDAAPSADAGGPPPAGPCPAGQVRDVVSNACGKQAQVEVGARDGFKLRTFVFLPDTVPAEGVPILVDRSPYRHFAPTYVNFYSDLGKFFASRGYAFVVQDCRRSPGLEDVIEPFRHEIADGQDTTHWIKKQPWSNGNIGMIGGSYDGYTAVAAAVDNPDVLAVVADDAPQDYAFERVNGTAWVHILGWMHFLDHASWMDDESTATATNSVDLRSLDQQFLGRTDPSYQAFLKADTPAPYPPEGTLVGRYGNTCAPILSVSSIGADLDAERIFLHARTEACPAHRDDQRFVITPDAHTEHLSEITTKRTPVNQLMLDFLDLYVGKRSVTLPPEQVLYASGQETDYAKTTLQAYPGKTTRTYTLGWPTASAVQGTLGASAVGVPTIGVDVDPAHMDPCVGDYPVLSYLSAPLAAPLRMLGTPSLELDIDATTPDVDVMAVLYDIDPSKPTEAQTIVGGYARARYQDGVSVPLVPGQVRHVNVPMGVTGHLFPAGHEIVVALVNAGCGLFENPNTGEPLAAQTQARATHFTVHHGSATRLVLPTP
jgi:predicted acyl esterase